MAFLNKDQMIILKVINVINAQILLEIQQILLKKRIKFIIIHIQTDYKKSRKNVIITCKARGDFSQTPNDHLNGNGCQKCTMSGYSKISLRWLNYIAKKDNIFIQHYDNIGEKKMKVNNKYIRFDGFCEDINTVFEFLGDFYHGNPNIYRSNDYNSLLKKTQGELYEKTVERNNLIIKLGYNLVTIWESDFIKLEKEQKNIYTSN